MSINHGYAALESKGALNPFEFDLGELGPEEVEIKVSHCGICHSDLSMLDNEWGFSRYPFVPGHEAVGTVVALGSDAKGLSLGQRVGSLLHCLLAAAEGQPATAAGGEGSDRRAGGGDDCGLGVFREE